MPVSNYFRSLVRNEDGAARRLLVRMLLLAGVAVLSFMAIAQAQRGSDENAATPVPAAAPVASQGQQPSDWPPAGSPTGQSYWPPANASAPNLPPSSAPSQLPPFDGQNTGMAAAAAAVQPVAGNRNSADPFINVANNTPDNLPTPRDHSSGPQDSGPSLPPLGSSRRSAAGQSNRSTDLRTDLYPRGNEHPLRPGTPSAETSLVSSTSGAGGRDLPPASDVPARFPPTDAGSSPAGHGADTDITSRGAGGFSSDPGGRRGVSGQLASLSSAREGVALPGDRQLEGGQTPTLKIEKFAPEEIHVNKTATFEIHVRNTGQVAARDVEVYDRVPKGTEFVSSSPQPQPAGRGELVWQFARLAPGERRVIRLQLRPTSTGEIGSVATVRFSADASVRTKCTCPELKVDLNAARQTLIGDRMQMEIEVTNIGDGPATGVVVAEQIPPQFQHLQGPTLENSLGTLMPRESRKLRLSLQAVKAGQAVNQLIVRADGDVHVEKQTELQVVSPALELEVEGPDHRYLERPASYAIRLQNPGTAAARTVLLTAQVPRGFRFLGANHYGQFDSKTRTVAWERGELMPGEEAAVELKLMPIEPGLHELHVEGRAQRKVTAAHTKAVKIEGVAAVQFTVLDVADPLEVGSETEYEVRVVNQGSKAATNVRLVADFPAGLQPLSGKGPSQAHVEGNRVVFAPLARLAPRADTTFTVVARGAGVGDHRVRFQLITAELQSPVMKEESTRVYADR